MTPLASTIPLSVLGPYVNSECECGFNKDLLMGRIVTAIHKYGDTVSYSQTPDAKSLNTLVLACLPRLAVDVSHTNGNKILKASIDSAARATDLKASESIESAARATELKASIESAERATELKASIESAERATELKASIDSAARATDLKTSIDSAARATELKASIDSAARATELQASIESAARATELKASIESAERATELKTSNDSTVRPTELKAATVVVNSRTGNKDALMSELHRIANTPIDYTESTRTSSRCASTSHTPIYTTNAFKNELITQSCTMLQ